MRCTIVQTPVWFMVVWNREVLNVFKTRREAEIYIEGRGYLDEEEILAKAQPQLAAV